MFFKLTMRIGTTIAVVLLLGSLPRAAAQQVVKYDTNMELFGLVYNVAKGLDETSTSYMLRHCREFCSFYDKLRSEVGGGRAVTVMKEVIANPDIRDHILQRLPLAYKEGYSALREGEAIPESLDDPLVEELVAALAELYNGEPFAGYLKDQYRADYDKAIAASPLMMRIMDRVAEVSQEMFGINHVEGLRVIPSFFGSTHVSRIMPVKKSDGQWDAVLLFGVNYDSESDSPCFDIPDDMYLQAYCLRIIGEAQDRFPIKDSKLNRLFTTAVREITDNDRYFEDMESYFNEMLAYALMARMLPEVFPGFPAGYILDYADYYVYLPEMVELLGEFTPIEDGDFYAYIPQLLDTLTPFDSGDY